MPVLLALVMLLPGRAEAQQLPRPPRLSVDYVVRSGDVLQIRVWPDSALGGLFPVEESGVVYLPVLGGVQVDGVGIGELRERLRRLYQQAYKEPTVSVTPLFRVSVIGGVQRPGLFQLTPTQNVFDAIAMAGGFTNSARKDRIRIVRESGTTELDAKKTLDRGGAELDLAMRSGDVIFVPERRTIAFTDVLYIAQTVLIVVSLFGKN